MPRKMSKIHPKINTESSLNIYKGKNAAKCFISSALDPVKSWAELKKKKAGT
jgi:hypothetical protein